MIPKHSKSSTSGLIPQDEEPKIMINLSARRESVLEFEIAVQTAGWEQSEVYSIKADCLDSDGNKCYFDIPALFTSQPAVIHLSILTPGRAYTVNFKEIKFTHPQNFSIKYISYPVTQNHCTGKNCSMIILK